MASTVPLDDEAVAAWQRLDQQSAVDKRIRGLRATAPTRPALPGKRQAAVVDERPMPPCVEWVSVPTLPPAPAERANRQSYVLHLGWGPRVDGDFS
eukprot:2136389-Pyramimonas_sp.AAC.1